MAPRGASANGRVGRIRVLMAIGEGPEGQHRISVFRGQLRTLGLSEGQNIWIEYRWAGGDGAKVQAFAKELVSLKPDVILANATVAAKALKEATSDVPVVFVLVSDPVGDGLV